MNFFQLGAFFRFYWKALTKYQLHSPFVYELAWAVLEDERWYYAFRDVELMRQNMMNSGLALQVEDFGAGAQTDQKPAISKRTVRSLARQSGSSAEQGRMLFRLARHLKPARILEMGTSLGIGTMYLASAQREARLISLEGSGELAEAARLNLEMMGLSAHTEIRAGSFEQQLEPALKELVQVDFVFFDGNHRPEPTLRYFEQCLAFAHNKTVFVWDDIHWSAGMSQAWEQIKSHPSITLTLDFFELSVAFIDPDFRVKQHFEILPARWKPWKVF